MHVFAKLGWWIVVACRWLVKASSFICVFMIHLGWHGVQFVYLLCACGCTIFQSLVGGLLLLVCGVSKLAFFHLNIFEKDLFELVCSL